MHHTDSPREKMTQQSPTYKTKKDLPILVKSLKLLEAAIGFEPMNNGFADRCLSHLAMPPFCGAGNGI